VLAVVVAGAAAVEVEVVVDCAVAAVDVELEPEAALATAAPPIAPATARTASALTMRGRMVGCLLFVGVEWMRSSQRLGGKGRLTPR
jgi:hypothetical protein